MLDGVQFVYGWFLTEKVVSCGFKRDHSLYCYVFDDDEQRFEAGNIRENGRGFTAVKYFFQNRKES